MLMEANPVGQPISRVDGRLKVTGRATYAAEAPIKGCVHAVIVQTTIGKGSITSIDTSTALKSPGVLAVLTHANMPPLDSAVNKLLAEKRPPLSDNKVHYFGQHMAVVIAETLEQAMWASKQLTVIYQAEKPNVTLESPSGLGSTAEQPSKQMGEELQFDKGDVKKALETEGVTHVTATYVTPIETHNPMEMSATVAAWEGEDKLTVWDATQSVIQRRHSMALAFGLKDENVRVLCPYVGGAFGCKGDQWMHAYLAANAAKIVKRPVKLMLTRAQMFTSCGHRPQLTQDLTVAATADGKLVAIKHDCRMDDSEVGHHIEPAAIGSSAVMYATPNLSFTHTVVRNNIASPTFMRAPGENPGTYALESAMDELAVALNMDPVELRRVNDAKADPMKELPFSTKNLNECLTIGAEKFGWAKRNPQPGSMKSAGGGTYGWGMAVATYPARRFPNQAAIRMLLDGDTVRVIGRCCSQDLGTGAWTVMTQMTAMLVGLPMEQAKFELGDSQLPPGAVSGGSASTAGVGQALSEAATKLRDEFHKIIQSIPDKDQVAFKKYSPDQIRIAGDKIVAVDADGKDIPGDSMDVASLIRRSGRGYVEGISEKSEVGADDFGSKRKKNTFQSFGCHFVEVEVGNPIPAVRVKRIVSVMDVGTIINPKTATSQVQGGVIMGVGQALLEETVYDDRNGKPVNDNLADYPVCVNADIGSIDVTLLDKPDPLFNAIGCRGVGEIGITGIAAAIANAVYHATGKRVREVPITMDMLM